MNCPAGWQRSSKTAGDVTPKKGEDKPGRLSKRQVIGMAVPFSYNPEYHKDWAWSMAVKGSTDQEIADAFGISRMTLHRWKKQFPELKEAIDDAKAIADSQVEKSLYRRALGFETVETEEIADVDEKGKVTVTGIKTKRKQVAPDTMAIMYWLNNRKRGQWAQRQEVQVEASNDSDTDVIIVLPHNKRQEHIEGTVEIQAEE